MLLSYIVVCACWQLKLAQFRSCFNHVLAKCCWATRMYLRASVLITLCSSVHNRGIEQVKYSAKYGTWEDVLTWNCKNLQMLSYTQRPHLTACTNTCTALALVCFLAHGDEHSSSLCVYACRCVYVWLAPLQFDPYKRISIRNKSCR